MPKPEWFPRITNRIEALRKDFAASQAADEIETENAITYLIDIVAELAQAVAEMQKPASPDAR